MALVLKDRVKETSVTAGTGTLTLAGASAGFQSFSAIGNGNTTYYAIVDSAAGTWEVGIGTYTSSGTTLSRTTVLSSSNSGSLVTFSSNSKDVFVTYPSEKSVYEDASNVVVQQSYGAITATSAALTTGTVSTTPAANTDIANKQYVDGLVTQGISYHEPVFVESPNTAGNLNATYNNGSSGVGATLTNAGTQVALTVDGILMTVGKRVLIYNQTAQAENGVYTVTTVGTVSTNWVLTRSTDANTYGLRDPNALGYNDAFFVTNGNTGAGETYVCTTTGTITFGTTAITFAQISSAQVYSAGTGLTLTNTTFSLTAPVTVPLGGTGLTSLTAGYIPFGAGTSAFGNSANLFWDSGNNRLGIGTSSPNYKLDVAGTANATAFGTTLAYGAAAEVYSSFRFNNSSFAGGNSEIRNIVDGSSNIGSSLVFFASQTGTGTLTERFRIGVYGQFGIAGANYGTSGQVLLSGGSAAAPSWSSTASSLSVGTATNIAGGANNRIVYQTGSGTTGFVAAPSASGDVVSWNGSSIVWSTPSGVSQARSTVLSLIFGL
jgi:hypothetical protein